MIRTKSIAKAVKRLVLEAIARLDESVGIARETETEVDFHDYRQRVAEVISRLNEHILHALYLEHPELEPEGLRRAQADRGPAPSLEPLEDRPLEEIIVERRLSRGDGRPVIVRIGKPVPYPEGDNFYCPFDIAGLDRVILSRAGGVDGVQALQLAMQKIGVILQGHNKETGDGLFWLDGDDPDLGFGAPSGRNTQ
jgi:hypothetical protein